MPKRSKEERRIRRAEKKARKEARRAARVYKTGRGRDRKPRVIRSKKLRAYLNQVKKSGGVVEGARAWNASGRKY